MPGEKETIQRIVATANSESNTMKEGIGKFVDFEREDILVYEVSDQALEAAAVIMEGQAKNVTISFCSGLDSCPS
jgi:hypothetical protein